MEPAPVSPAATPPTYDAFISYRHADADRRAATWLHRALEAWRTPKALVATGVPSRLRTVFRDEDEMHAGAHLTSQIDAALAASCWLLVVCSPRTPASPWVEHEIRRFREWGRGERILPLLIEGEPETSFPSGLRDGPAGPDADPLAADLRPPPGTSAADARSTALLRLLAPMLGVRFDDLRRREAERSVRRRRVIAAASTAGFLLVATLGYLGLRAESRASASERAEQAARRETEELVQYLLADVSPTLAGGARVEVLKGYLDRIGRHFAAHGTAQPKPEEQVQRAATLFATALVRGDRSDLPGALDGFREAEGMLEAIPPDGVTGTRARQLRVSVLRRTAATLTELGRPDPALREARAAVAVARTLVAEAPDDPGARRLLGLALSTVGSIGPKAHAVREGRAALDEAVTILAALVGPGDGVPERAALAAARRNLAPVLAAQGDPVGALREARAAAVLIRASDEDDLEASVERAESLELLAEALFNSADVQEACDTQRAALLLRERSVRFDPRNDRRLLLLCASRRLLAPMLVKLGNAVEADRELDRAFDALEGLRARDPENSTVVGEWAVTVSNRSDGYLRRGERDRALAESKRAVDALGALRASGKADRVRRTYEVQILIGQADIFEALADLVGWRRAIERALALARELLREDGTDVSLSITVVHARMELAMVLLKAGEVDPALAEARAAVDAANALLAAAPTEVERLSLVAFSNDRWGRVLRQARQGEPALAAFVAARRAFEAKLAAEGGSQSTVRELAVAHMQVGDVLMDLERFEEALVAYRAARDALPAPSTAPGDAVLERQTSSAIERLARSLAMLHRYPASASAFDDAATHQAAAVRGGQGDAAKVEELLGNARLMRQCARADELIATGAEPATPEERLDVARLLSERGRDEEALDAFRVALAARVDDDVRRRCTGDAAMASALVARKRPPEEARRLRAQALVWLREHVVLTWEAIRKLQDASATLPRDQRRVPDGQVGVLRRGLAELHDDDPDLADLRGTPEFEAAFAQPADSTAPR